MPAAVIPNTKQRDEWNKATGSRWQARHELIDTYIAPFGHRAMDRASIGRGQRVLDIGCGAGETTFEMARRVGGAGMVVGVDISALLLETARQSAEGQRLLNVRFEEADAQTYPFATQSFDVAFSRFGIMFFDDPVAAFRNIRSALRPDGRLAFVCWPAPQENLFVTIPLSAAARHIEMPPPTDPNAPGPFAFANADRVRGILDQADFTRIEIDRVAGQVAGGTLDDTAEMLLQVGPLAEALENLAEPLVVAIRADIRAALRPYEHSGRVVLGAVAWLVTAQA